MAYWLFKEEPDHYSYADLERDKSALWDGVTNALARQHLRQARAGDRVLYYHTGKEKAVVGEMRITRDPYPDPAGADVARSSRVPSWTTASLGRGPRRSVSISARPRVMVTYPSALRHTVSSRLASRRSFAGDGGDAVESRSGSAAATSGA